MGETTITIKKKDDSPGRGQRQGNLAGQGIRGDTQLAHVNPWEQMLLKALGGAGTTNPKTGLKQFYTLGTGNYATNPNDIYYYPGQNFTNDIASWYQNAFGRAADPAGLSYWQGLDAGSLNDDALWNQFLGAGNNEAYTGWSPTSGVNTQSDINLPDDIYPSSTQTSTSVSGSNQGSQNTSSNQSYNYGNQGAQNIAANQATNKSSNYSGLPAQFQNQLLSAIIPQLMSEAGNFNQNVDDYTNNALSGYQQILNNAIKQNIPKELAGLANRGIMSSTAGNNILSDVISNAALDASNKGYTTAMQSAMMKATLPALLTSMAQLGQSSTGESTGMSSGLSQGSSFGNTYGLSSGSSQGTSYGTSGSSSNANSYYSDPTQMYSIMAQIMSSMYEG